MKLIHRDKKTPLIGEKISVRSKGDTLLELTTDKRGFAEIPVAFKNTYESADLFLTSFAADNNYLGRINFSMAQEILIYLPKKYLRKREACPKCKKRRHVKYVIHGDGGRLKMIVNRGDTTYTTIFGRKMYMLSCLRSDFSPSFYCEKKMRSIFKRRVN
ncbi:MAG: hypothetical protein MI784_16690 [Cytophagales bacterium]|nr:hypothetical protein [Cytophagales bacterium]